MLLIMAGIFISPATLRTHPPQEKSEVEKWREDLEQLAVELPKRHKNLFFSRTADEFHADIQELKENLGQKSTAEVLFSVARIIAACGDAHTGVRFQPQNAFPFSLYWFKDGIFCINAQAEYKDILDCRLIAIEDKPIAEVIQILTQAIPHENDSQLRSNLPFYMILVEMLHGSGIIADPEKAVFTFQKQTGERLEIEVGAISMRSKFTPVSNKKDTQTPPLYEKYRNSAYAFEYQPASRLLYVAYNSCRELKDQPFKDFVHTIFGTVRNNQVDYFVIDLRNNGGGNSNIFSPMLAQLKQNEKINRKDRLFVILGRRTFSSAVLNAIQLKNLTNATFVGEPTGGRPNHFGEVQMFKLKNSGLAISYSIKYFTMAKEDTDSFYPDITVELTLEDYLNGRDPVLADILR